MLHPGLKVSPHFRHCIFFLVKISFEAVDFIGLFLNIVLILELLLYISAFFISPVVDAAGQQRIVLGSLVIKLVL